MSIFQNLKLPFPKYGKYNLSHEVKASMKIGNLYPVLTLDVLPGDKFNVQTNHVIKLQPMLAPVMHTMEAKLDYFYVPYRMVSENFNEFALGIDPEANPPYVTTNGVFTACIEYFTQTGSTAYLRKVGVGTLWDFLGYPTPTIANPNWDNTESVNSWIENGLRPLMNDVMLSALPILAFRCVWNNYFKWYEQEDSDLWEDFIKQNKNISPLVARSFTIDEPANWQRDYFTSAMTTPQAGDPVTIQAQLVNDFDGIKDGKVSTLNVESPEQPDGWYNSTARLIKQDLEGETLAYLGTNKYDTQGMLPNLSDVSKNVQVNVTQHTKVGAIDVDILQEAFAMQRIKQLMQIGGNKPIDRLKSLWGVNSSDLRMQVPEYLGGGRAPVMISSVLQQSNDSAQGYALGTQAGQGISASDVSRFKRKFEEHGIVIGIMRIVPKTAYYQGVSRDLLRVAQGDFAMPQLSHLGEQSIKNCELYFASQNPEGTFGYQSRYADYKYKPDRVHGDFKTPQLDYWHMARRFDEEPQLTPEFQKIDADSVQSNIFAYGESDTLLCDMYHSVIAERKLLPNIM